MLLSSPPSCHPPPSCPAWLYTAGCPFPVRLLLCFPNSSAFSLVRGPPLLLYPLSRSVSLYCDFPLALHFCLSMWLSLSLYSSLIRLSSSPPVPPCFLAHLPLFFTHLSPCVFMSVSLCPWLCLPPSRFLSIAPVEHFDNCVDASEALGPSP